MDWWAAISVCSKLVSSSLVAGSSSHTVITPSITPLDMASETCEGGMLTGAAPMALRNLPMAQVAARMRRPFRSCMLRMGCRAVWNLLSPPTNTPSILNSRMSSAASVFMNSHMAALVVSRSCGSMSGSSITSERGKRPGE